MKNIKTLLKYSLVVLPLLTLLAFRPANQPVGADLVADMPDLLVRGIQFPEGFKTGTCTDVRVAIANKGRVKAGTFKVELYLSPNGYPITTHYLLVKGIGAKQTKWITFKDVPVPGKSQTKLQVKVDFTNSINESDEYNNKKLIYPTPKGSCKNAPLPYSLGGSN